MTSYIESTRDNINYRKQVHQKKLNALSDSIEQQLKEIENAKLNRLIRDVMEYANTTTLYANTLTDESINEDNFMKSPKLVQIDSDMNNMKVAITSTINAVGELLPKIEYLMSGEL